MGEKPATLAIYQPPLRSVELSDLQIYKSMISILARIYNYEKFYQTNEPSGVRWMGQYHRRLLTVTKAASA